MMLNRHQLSDAGLKVTEVFFFFYIVKVVRMISVDQKRSPAKEQPFQLIELST